MLIIWGFVRSDTVLSLQQSHLWTFYIEGSQKSVHHLDENPGLLCTVVHELQSTSYTLTCDKQYKSTVAYTCAARLTLILVYEIS